MVDGTQHPTTSMVDEQHSTVLEDQRIKEVDPSAGIGQVLADDGTYHPTASMAAEQHSTVLEDQRIKEVDPSAGMGQVLGDPDFQTDASELKAQIAPMKFSFAKPKFTAARPPLFPTLKLDKPEDVEYVTEFDEKGRKVSQAATRIIPLHENSWRPEKRMKNIMMESDQSVVTEDRFETDTLSAGPQPDVQYGLIVRVTDSDPGKKSEIVHVAEVNGPVFTSSAQEAGPSVSEREEQTLREEILALPEETSLDAYENMPVEEFGQALLRGMGWEEGKPIGRTSKTTVSPIEYTKRVGREGLGAIPAPKPEKVKRYMKPGETRGSKPTVGKYMSIIAGLHAGFRGRIMEANGNSFALKLDNGGEKVHVRLEELAEIGSSEEEKAMKRLREMRIQRVDDDSNVDGRSGLATDNSNFQVEGVEKRDEGRVKKKEDTDREGSRKERLSASTASNKELEWSETSRHQRQRDDRTGSRHRKYDDERHGGEGKSRSRREDDDYSHSGKSHSNNDGSRGERSKDRNYEKAEDLRHSEKGKSEYADRYERGDADRQRVGDKSIVSFSRERSKDCSRGERSKDRNYEKAEDFRPSEKGKSEYADVYERGGADRQRVDSRSIEGSFSSDRQSRSHKEKDKMKNLGGRRESKEEVAARNSSIVCRHTPWLVSQIRVKIVDKNAYGGKLYLRKGHVTDVVSPFICDIKMDESGELIQQVKQEHLQTALPKRGGRVMVVGGKYRGLMGKLQERDSEKGVGLVEMEANYDVHSLNLDDLAEFVGSSDEMNS